MLSFAKLDLSGYVVQAGIRARFAQDFEADALVHYMDFDICLAWHICQ